MQSSNEQRYGLIAEIERYLRAVDTFRREGREPHWRPEPAVRKPRRKEAPC